jgi:hypothetical protein
VSNYHEKFPAGTRVRIASREELERFRREWRLHNPLGPAQLDFADREATVAEVGFYHGGDVLYTLSGVPGVWHEHCLSSSL